MLFPGLPILFNSGMFFTNVHAYGKTLGHFKGSLNSLHISFLVVRLKQMRISIETRSFYPLRSQ